MLKKGDQINKETAYMSYRCVITLSFISTILCAADRILALYVPLSAI